jgi:hypothetical protein
MEDTTFWLELLKHPILFVMAMIAGLVFIGMTYEFILRMFNKSAPGFPEPKSDGDEGTEPPEPANVPKPPTPPKDTLKGAEEIPDGAEEVENEDGTTTVEYTYDDTDSGQSTSRWYAGDCLSPNWSAEGDKTEDNPYDNNPYDNWPEPWAR